MFKFYDRDNNMVGAAYDKKPKRDFYPVEKYYFDDETSERVDNPHYDDDVSKNSLKEKKNKDNSQKLDRKMPKFHKFISALIKKEETGDPTEYDSVLKEFKKVLDKYPMEP